MRRSFPCIALLSAAPAMASTYHVEGSGSNANNGLSAATAWATLQFAADHLSAGDTVLVGPGGYVGFNLQDRYASQADPTVFLCQGAVVITSPCTYNDLDGINIENAAWVEVRGFEVNGMPRAGIRTALSDHVTIADNSCHANGVWGIFTGFAEHCIIEHNRCTGSIDQHGIYFSNSADHPVIRYNTCANNHDNGIHMNGDASQGGDGVISDARVYGNVIHDNGTGGGSGINCDGVVGSYFYNNLLYGNHASGISLYMIDAAAPSSGDRVFNNTIVNAADARWCVNITEGCTDNQVLNNILINQHPWRGSITCDASALSGFVSDHNLVVNSFSTDGGTAQTLAEWQALGYDAHSLIAAPLSALFVDVASGDLHLLNANAQAVDAGTSGVQAVVTDDLDGTLRPQGAAYDIGCYELAGVTGMATGDRDRQGPIRDRGDRIEVSPPAGGGRLIVLDGAGRVCAERRLNASTAEVRWNGTGLFVVQVLDANGMPLAALRCVR